jgi:hypothetical protein
MARRAQELAGECQQRGDEARAVLLLAQIAALDDPPAIGDAEAHFRAAVIRGEQLGMRPEVAHCHFGLAKLYCRTGDRAKGEKHLTTATMQEDELCPGMSTTARRAIGT